ncbi:ABC transporter permease [Kamptonema cortianum]|nr:ABC transporter permease [Kamptonema cortianum]
MSRRILSQCRKELAQFQRDRLTLALAFILPLMTLLIFGFAIRLEVQNIALAVRDYDNSPLSRAYIERLFATRQFQPVRTAELSSIHPETIIDRGKAKALVLIPPDFSRQIQSGFPVDVQILVDGTDVNNARIIKNSLQATTQFFFKTNSLSNSCELNCCSHSLVV